MCHYTSHIFSVVTISIMVFLYDTFLFSMDKLPRLYSHMPNPVYWYSKLEQKGFIIFTPWSGDSETRKYCLFKYDIQERKYYESKPYDHEISPQACGHAINTDTDELYIFGGHGNVFAKYNLIADEWKFMEFSECGLKTNVSYPGWCMLPPPYNQLHVYHGNGDDRDFFTLNGDKFVKTHTFTYLDLAPKSNAKMIFINDNLFIFGGNKSTKNIYRCKITEQKQTKYEWKLCDLKLPEAPMSFRHGYKCILAFDNILIIFKLYDKGDGQTHGLYRWYLDLGDIEDKELR